MDTKDTESWHSFHTGPAHRELIGLLRQLSVWIGLIDFMNVGPRGKALAQAAAKAAGTRWLIYRFQARRLWRLLEVAEAATRRLIVIAARDLREAASESGLRQNKPQQNSLTRPNTDQPAQDKPARPDAEKSGVGAVSTDASPSAAPSASAPSVPLFRLYDTPKRYDWFFNPGAAPPCPAFWYSAPADLFEEVNVSGAMRRLAALAGALNDIPHQVSRYELWRARRERLRQTGEACSLNLLRVGDAPGAPSPALPEIDRRPEHFLLMRLHELARYAQLYPVRTPPREHGPRDPPL